MLERFLSKLKTYGEDTSYIESIVLVGSYANGREKEDSDIDIVIITSNKASMIKNPNFINEFGNIAKKQIEYYKACTSIRSWYKDGKEIEFGIVDSSWIKPPLDKGTYNVLSNGYEVIIDKKGYFKDIKLS